MQYHEARGELGPEIDEAIALAEQLRKTLPEVTQILLEYYVLKISQGLTHGT